MCGFLFVQQNTPFVESQIEILNKALEILEYRGPDFKDSIIKDGRYFGHARLSIQDVSSNSHQPIEDENSIMLFNGEIYNHRDVSDGYSSDTLFLKDFLNKGGSVSLLNGMFSILEFKKKTNEVTVYRDYYGEKPLYYFQSNDLLLISSTLKSLSFLLRKLYNIDLEIKQSSVIDYLFFGYIREPKTIYKQIRIIPRNSVAKFSRNEVILKELYSESNFEINSFRNNILNTVDTTDVTPYLLLSGGVDSTFLLNELVGNKRDITSLSLSSKDKLDEVKQINTNLEELRNFYKAKIVNEVFHDDQSNKLKKFDKFIRILEQPSSDGFNLYSILDNFRKKKIKLIMTGLGGDELFGGYNSFKNFNFLRFPRFNYIAGNLLKGRLERFKYQQSLIDYGLDPILAYYYLYRLDFSFINYFTLNEVIMNAAQLEAISCKNSAEPIRKLKQFETFDYMTNQLLRDNDNVSMSFGIEARSPLLLNNAVNNCYNNKSLLKKQLSTVGIKLKSKVGFNHSPFSNDDCAYMNQFNNENFKNLLDINITSFKNPAKIYILLKWLEYNTSEDSFYRKQ